MDKMTTAQKLRMTFFGEVKVGSYKAPHAPQGTPNKAHRPRKYWDTLKFSARLGLRPPVFGGRV